MHGRSGDSQRLLVAHERAWSHSIVHSHEEVLGPHGGRQVLGFWPFLADNVHL